MKHYWIGAAGIFSLFSSLLFCVSQNDAYATVDSDGATYVDTADPSQSMTRDDVKQAAKAPAGQPSSKPALKKQRPPSSDQGSDRPADNQSTAGDTGTL